MTEGQGRCLALLGVGGATVLGGVQVMSTWAAEAAEWHESGRAAAVAVGVAWGFVGWWLLFRWIGPRLARLVTRYWGPNGLPLGARWNLGEDEPTNRRPIPSSWLQLIYAAIVLLPLAQMFRTTP